MLIVEIVGNTSLALHSDLLQSVLRYLDQKSVIEALYLLNDF